MYGASVCHAEELQAEADLAMDSGTDAIASASPQANRAAGGSPEPREPTPQGESSLPSMAKKADESDGVLLAVKTGAPVLEMVAQVWH